MLYNPITFTPSNHVHPHNNLSTCVLAVLSVLAVLAILTAIYCPPILPHVLFFPSLAARTEIRMRWRTNKCCWTTVGATVALRVTQ